MHKELFIVYMATHPDFGEYVGFTSTGISVRKSTHYTQAKAGCDTPFHHALRVTEKNDWEWWILEHTYTREDAGMLEQKYIESKKPSLNVRLGGTTGGGWKEGYVHGGYKNKGKKASLLTKQKLSKFQRTRPRTRSFNRQRAFLLFGQGKSQKEIASILNCDQSFISRILSGDYTT